MAWCSHQFNHSNDSTESDSEIAIAEKTKLQSPPKWVVLLHNDDYTTMEFVIEILSKFFQKNLDEATRIMLEVHVQGKGVAGIYSRDIAETKAQQVIEYARANGHPLLATAEPA